MSDPDAVELPWWPEDRPGSLGLDKIAAAAIELIDEGGESHLTMRRLAERLDASPMAIYWYVDDRTELLAVVRDAAMAPVVEAIARAHDVSGWADRLRVVARALRTEFVERHPNLLATVATDRFMPGPNLVTLMDRALRSLIDDGLSESDAAWSLRMVADIALHTPLVAGYDNLVDAVGQGISGAPRWWP